MRAEASAITASVEVTSSSGAYFLFLDESLAAIMGESERQILYRLSLYTTLFVLFAEVIFFFVVYFHLLPSLQRLTKPHAYKTDTVVYMKRVLDLVKEIKSYTFEKYMAGFFRGAKYEDVRQGNFLSFLAWAMFGKEIKNLTSEEVEKIEKVSGYAASIHPAIRTVEPGFNPDIKHCCMTYKPIPTIHRPLMSYVIIAMVEALANFVFLHMRGFQRLEVNGMTYWYRKQAGSSATEGPNARRSLSSSGDEPVVFLHGISTGWMLYLQLARALSQNRTLILIDLNAVKIKSMTFKMPTPEEFAANFRRVLDRHRIPRANVVGHSFGSITAGWLVSLCSDRVSHLTLLDPVSMLLSFPEVSYSFLYRSPVKLTEWIIYLMASRELTISHTLHRHFWWYNNNLWLEDVPAHIGVTVGLASHDEIINPRAVQEYVHNCAAKRLAAAQSKSSTPEDGQDSSCPTHLAGISCVMWEGFSHGQILIPGAAQAALVAEMKGNEKRGAVLL
jgi:pimeloyl-ACP methyl ester carboxylesterase